LLTDVWEGNRLGLFTILVSPVMTKSCFSPLSKTYRKTNVKEDKSMITAQTQLLGIIGHPIEHSLSPHFQNAALSSLVLLLSI
jgi:hypothetical protein